MKMKKLIILKNHDQLLLEQALKLNAEILLMQDAVLFSNSGISTNKKLTGTKIYALKRDVEARGIKDRIIQGINLVDYDEMVDLFFSGKTVLNL
jgi:sulfur relay protein TusB/DsrH